jgi:TonB family protein
MSLRNFAGLMASAMLLNSCAWLQSQQALRRVPVAQSAPVAASAPISADAAQSDAAPSFLPPPLHSEGSRAEPTDSLVLRTISLRVRQHLIVPRGHFPKNAQVRVEAKLTPEGIVLSPKVSRSSGFKALDIAVLRALKSAQPLPVPPSIRRSGQTQTLRLLVHPLLR